MFFLWWISRQRTARLRLLIFFLQTCFPNLQRSLFFLSFMTLILMTDGVSLYTASPEWEAGQLHCPQGITLLPIVTAAWQRACCFLSASQCPLGSGSSPKPSCLSLFWGTKDYDLSTNGTLTKLTICPVIKTQHFAKDWNHVKHILKPTAIRQDN